MSIERIRRRMRHAARLLTAIALLGTSALANAMNAPAQRDPQFDTAMRAAVREYPQLVQGSARNGYYALSVVARADGTIHKSSLLFLGPPPGLPEVQDAETRFANAIEGPARAKIRKGEQIADVGRAANNVQVTWYVLPEGFDESRDVRRVARAVLALYSSPLRPTRDAFDSERVFTEINLLTIFMNEDGVIARRAMEPIPLAQVESMNPRPLHTAYFGASALTPPPVPAEVFKVLGLQAEEIGQTGLLLVEPERKQLEPGAMSPEQREELETALQQLRSSPAVLVRFAWPRRPGEPVGGRANGSGR